MRKKWVDFVEYKILLLCDKSFLFYYYFEVILRNILFIIQS
jgi:hypothetical protein